MDTETLVNVTPISSQDVELGQKFADVLREESTVGARAALWWYDAETFRWKFLVATSAYSEKGPRATYSLIRKALVSNDLLRRLPLDRVRAVEAGDATVSAIRRVIGSAEHIQFYNCTIAGTYVAGVYVYWVGKKRAGARKRTRRAN